MCVCVCAPARTRVHAHKVCVFSCVDTDESRLIWYGVAGTQYRLNPDTRPIKLLVVCVCVRACARMCTCVHVCFPVWILMSHG